MSTYAPLSRYWRVPVVALLAAILAFAASYLVYPTYESSTRLLVHGRDATFLTSTGKDLTAQPGVVDASLSQALLSTYAGIATSRTVATEVVEHLELDQEPESTSPYAAVAQALAWVYRCGRAFFTSGFCAPVDPYEKAVLDVQEGTSAAPAGTNEGETAGQGGSYVLEVHSSGRTPEQARDITDAVADQLVRQSNQRFKADAEQSVARLEKQVATGEADLKARTRAVATYQTANGISTADAKQALSAATYESVRASLITARADLADSEAQIASVRRSISQIPKEQRSKQTIVTGRSTTEMNTDSTNTVYADLQTKLSTLQAEQDGHAARVERLAGEIDSARPLTKNGPLAELALLQQGVDLAAANVKDLTTDLQTARSTAVQGSVDLSRLDEASQPTYPTKPKRYIYLALGLLIGGLLGAALTAHARRPLRRRPSEVITFDNPDPTPTDGRAANEEDEGIDLILAGDGGPASRTVGANGNGHAGKDRDAGRAPWSPT